MLATGRAEILVKHGDVAEYDSDPDISHQALGSHQVRSLGRCHERIGLPEHWRGDANDSRVIAFDGAQAFE